MPDEHKVTILPSARRELEALPAKVIGRAATAIAQLKHDPRPRGCRKLATGKSDYRLRVGDYGVLYQVLEFEREGEVQTEVEVYRIRHRSAAYR